jgi:hypothetical protein
MGEVGNNILQQYKKGNNSYPLLTMESLLNMHAKPRITINDEGPKDITI